MNNIKTYVDRYLWVMSIITATITAISFRDFYVEYLFYINIILIILLILISFKYFHLNNISIKELDSDDLYTEVIKESKKLNKVLICNPDKSHIWLNKLNKELVEQSCEISYVGDAEDFIRLLEFIPNNEFGNNSDKLITDFGYNNMYIILTGPDKKYSVIAYVINNKSYLIRIRNNVLNNFISVYVDNKTLSNGINLNKFDNPKTILNILNNKQHNYLQGFNELKSGAITFYGTEVLEVQAGWMENNDFKEICTLDLTTNPAIFKSRTRYNKVNEKFLDNDGIVRRVYMIEEKKLEDKQFCEDLFEAINYQIKIGVKIGLQFIDELPTHCIQDFIVYGDNIVLVENKQADKNYSVASSTAYFHKDKITSFKQTFQDVWGGMYSQQKPKINADNFIAQWAQRCVNMR